MRNSEKTTNIVLTGLLAAVVFAATCFSFPNGVGGYTHAGDAAVVVALMLLGRKYGAAAAGIGAMLSDILLGYAMWAPFTLVAKVVLVVVMTRLLDQNSSRAWWLLSAVIAFAAETVIYSGAAFFLEGGIGGAIAEAGGMLVQGIIGIAVGAIVTTALYRTKVGTRMHYVPGGEPQADHQYNSRLK